MQKLLVFFLFTIPLFTGAQTVSVEFRGKTCNLFDSTDLIPAVEIILTQGRDTIDRIFSDSAGHYVWKKQLKAGDELTFTAKRKFFMTQNVNFKVPSFSSQVSLNFSLVESKIDQQNDPIFESGVWDEFSGFDLDLLTHGLRKYEHVCIEFLHVTYSHEGDDLAQKRLLYFKKYLISKELDLSNFTFNFSQVKLDCQHEDCRGRIQGRIISLSSDCP